VTRRPASVVAALALGATLLTGCSEGEPERAAERAADRVRDEVKSVDDLKLPDVDWEKEGRQLKRRVDRLAEQADCGQLRKLAKREQNDVEVTRYVKALVRRTCR
jgi:hypothetical protein